MEEMMQTSRLYIVPLTLDHAEKVYALTSQEKVARYMRFDTHSSLSQVREFCAEWSRRSCHAYWIEEKQTGKSGWGICLEARGRERCVFFVRLSGSQQLESGVQQRTAVFFL